MIIRIEETPHGNWHASVGAFGVVGATRLECLQNARSAHPEAMRAVPLQPEEIPDELREISRRMRAVSEPLIYFGGFGLRGDLGRSLEAQAPILAAWADEMAAPT